MKKVFKFVFSFCHLKELYTWDKGNQLTYPTRYHEIGNNVSSSEKTDDLNPQMQSGYDVYHDNGNEQRDEL